MTQCARILEILADDESHSHLRKRGHEIECTREGDDYRYQLVSSPRPLPLVSPQTQRGGPEGESLRSPGELNDWGRTDPGERSEAGRTEQADRCSPALPPLVPVRRAGSVNWHGRSLPGEQMSLLDVAV